MRSSRSDFAKEISRTLLFADPMRPVKLGLTNLWGSCNPPSSPSPRPPSAGVPFPSATSQKAVRKDGSQIQRQLNKCNIRSLAALSSFPSTALGGRTPLLQGRQIPYAYIALPHSILLCSSCGSQLPVTRSGLDQGSRSLIVAAGISSAPPTSPVLDLFSSFSP